MIRLEAAAKFLGEGYRTGEYLDEPCVLHQPHTSSWVQMEDDPLCMALLRKAAERGYFVQLEYCDAHVEPDEKWIADIRNAQGTGPTPLDAVLAAIEQLEDGV